MAKRSNISKSADETQRDQRYQQTRQALRAMKRILMHFRLLMDDELRPQGVTTAQMQVLFAVQKTPGSSGAQLARSCYITPQTTQALLKHLEAAGFIVRGKDPVNDRIVTARITPEGERLVQSVEKTVRVLQDGLWQGVTDSELTQFNALLKRCLCNLDIADESAASCR